MKKLIKRILSLIGIFIAIPLAFNGINAIIGRWFSRNKKKYRKYTWRFGDIRYTKNGDGSPILLVHGTDIGSSSFEWNKNIEELAKNYTVYAIDLLGYGFSDKPAISYSAYLYATLINDFTTNIIGEPTGIIAANNAGVFAVMANRLETGLTSKLLLINPTVLNNKKITHKDKLINKLIKLPIWGTFIYNILSSRMNRYKHLKKNITNATWKLAGLYSKTAHTNIQGAKYAIADYYTKYLDIDIKQALSKTTIPIQIILGKNSKRNNTNNIETIKNSNSNIIIKVIENSGAMPYYEKAEEFNNTCKGFF